MPGLYIFGKALSWCASGFTCTTITSQCSLKIWKHCVRSLILIIIIIVVIIIIAIIIVIITIIIIITITTNTITFSPTASQATGDVGCDATLPVRIR